jgi:hypothetical protein
MLITLSIIEGLDNLEFHNEDVSIRFYNYMDRMWGEVNNNETNETLFECQITNSHELNNICEEIAEYTDMDSITILGIIVKKLLDIGETVIGVDSLNDYYDTALKRARLEILMRNKKFKFIKADISCVSDMDALFKKYNFEFVFHFPNKLF